MMKFYRLYIVARQFVVFFVTLTFLANCKTVALPPEIQTASYVIKGIQFYFAYMTPNEITVQSKGSGNDENEAIDKAIVAAVQQAMGVLVVSELTASDEKILSDLAGMYSSGIVKSYVKKKCTGTSVVKCTIEAKVMPFGIRDSIFSNKSTKIVDGGSLYGQFSSAKASLIQRKKLTEYYFSRIRSIGLQAKLESIDVIPSLSEKAEISLSYSIDWNDNFRSEIISFLKYISDGPNSEEFLLRLLLGTPPGDISSGDPNDVEIRWGPMRGILSQSVIVKTYDRSFASMIHSKLQEHIQFEFSPFGICDSFEPYGYNGILFFASQRPVTRTLRFKVDPDILRQTKKVTILPGCKVQKKNPLRY